LLDAPMNDSEWPQLEPSQGRQRTLDGVKGLLGSRKPGAAAHSGFEDLHWIDTETQGLLDSLVESVPTVRLLLLTHYRPECQHVWAGNSYYRQIRIGPALPRDGR
jgi:hypothetical protein